MKHTRRFLQSILLALLLCFATTAGAGEKLLITGAEGGAGDTENFYTFAGLIMPVFGEKLGNGLVQRYWVDILGYSYDTNQEIDALGFGLEGALGYQTSSSKGWAGAYLGLRYNNLSTSPDDPGNDNDNEHVWLKTQLEGQWNFAEAWKLTGIASYLFAADSYWMRTQLLHDLNMGLTTGPEVVFMGDPNYRALQLGWVVSGFKPTPTTNVGVRVGVRLTEGAGANGLIGVELLKMF